jgi:hypothetical protein
MPVFVTNLFGHRTGWPSCAWTWAQRTRTPLKGPQVAFFYASYAEKLSLEHSIECLRLIQSRWFSPAAELDTRDMLKVCRRVVARQCDDAE